jgi:polar amino acid transport system substrate-binding protein
LSLFLLRYLCCVVFIIFTFKGFAQEQITVCAEDKAYPPFINYSHASIDVNPGFTIDTILSAAKESGIQVKFIRRPWKRCKQMVQQGQVQALMPMIKTPDRESLYQFPENAQHLLEIHYYVFFHPAHHLAEQLSQLSVNSVPGVKLKKQLTTGIAAPLGYVTYNWLKTTKLLPKATYSLEQGIKLVSTNKLDGYIFSKRVTLHKFANLIKDNSLTFGKQAFLVEKLYLPVNKHYYKKNKKLMDYFWRRLELNRKD